MVYLEPDERWLYLILYGSFMVFILIFGTIIILTQRKKKKQKQETIEET